MAVAVDSKHNTMGGGIHFPMTNDVKMALGELKSRRLDYIQMSVDTKAEIINLEEKGSCSVEDLPKKVPENAPRYHLFLFKHTHEGDSLASVGKKKNSQSNCHLCTSQENRSCKYQRDLKCLNSR